jgi:hypothetical protein
VLRDEGTPEAHRQRVPDRLPIVDDHSRHPGWSRPTSTGPHSGRSTSCEQSALISGALDALAAEARLRVPDESERRSGRHDGLSDGLCELGSANVDAARAPVRACENVRSTVAWASVPFPAAGIASSQWARRPACSGVRG